MLGLVLDDSLPLLLPQFDVDGAHNEALPLELDAIGPYQGGGRWLPIIPVYFRLVPNYAGYEDVPIIPTIMPA